MRIRESLSDALLAFLPPTAGHAESPSPPSADWRETYACTTGMQAVVYRYPVVHDTMARYGMVQRPIGQVDSPLEGWNQQRRSATDAGTRYYGIQKMEMYSDIFGCTGRSRPA